MHAHRPGPSPRRRGQPRSTRFVVPAASMLLLAALPATPGVADDGTVLLLLDGVEVASVVIDGTILLDDPVAISGSASDGSWSASWDLVLDANPIGGASIGGDVEFENLTSATRDLEVVIDLPFCRLIDGPTLVGGSASLSLLANAGGGMLSVPVGESGLSALVGGAAAATMFDAPFFVFTSGSGLVSTSGDFGLPAPSLAGPDFADGMELALSFRITGGDTLAADLSYALAAQDPADIGDCLGDNGPLPSPDINGDGVVGVQDFLFVIYSWGECGGCPADLDLNGLVDFFDLTVVLHAWDA